MLPRVCSIRNAMRRRLMAGSVTPESLLFMWGEQGEARPHYISSGTSQSAEFRLTGGIHPKMFPRVLATPALALAGLALVACRTADPVRDQAPTLSNAERAALAQLAPAELPRPPPDTSNRWADDPAAAKLGQRFFMDPSFSGRLLDGDNDGRPNTVGFKGETGKVSCAGCHIPAWGFVDDRTLNKQISLAAGWNLRRTPSLLDVGQAKLLMWDGRRDAFYNQPFHPIESATEMNSSRLYVAEQIY